MTNGRLEEKCSASDGFSLAELIIVIMCVAVLCSIALPGISRLQSEWNLWGGARILESSLQWGRMHAISANTPVLFMVDADRQKFYWMDPESGNPYAGSVRRLPGNLRITGCPRTPLRFYQHGNAAPAGTYTIAGDVGSYSVVVAPGGRIRIRKN